MYDSTIQTDYVKSELEYRLGRIRADIAGRRSRRLMGRLTGGLPGSATTRTSR